MKIDHISISRESTWQECELRYKYHYDLQLPSPVPTPFYFTFGKIVHVIIDEHTKARGAKSISRVKSEILSGQIELEPGVKAPPLDNEQHKNLTRHLNNYLRLVEQIGYEGETEWGFYVELDPPNQRHLKGFIDRLLVKNGSASIIDFKTTKPSRWRKDGSNITKDLQLACYAWVVMQEFKIPAKNITAALYYLDDAKLVPVRFSERTLLTVPERLVKVYKTIQEANPDYVKGNVGQHCTRCDYRKICPFYSLVEK